MITDHRRMGLVQFGGRTQFLACFAQIAESIIESAPALKTSLRGGGGGGELVHFFFSHASIGIGVHAGS